ncbi:MAG: multifunctional CCA addition/repair protein [Betaproteobacteria bacterium]|nr:multifunctional CCA addition/repair protein [Betaproteobacteria bacterium]
MTFASESVYIVGGAVRDELLGLPIKDKDYVVVGSTPESMLAAGFKAVGKDFPVFLHPVTHDEYALARTERKTAKGYKGFVVHASPDVTLEEDLARRDFTINAIAKDGQGRLIDPFNGQVDIQARVLRHVSIAFVEDPVRILRAARFSARLPDFNLAPETLTLMRSMVDAGEVDALVAERVWQELAKGLMEEKPSRMFETLRACGALQKILPTLDRLWGMPQPPQHHPEVDAGVHVMLVIDYAASKHFSLPVRFAALMHNLGKESTTQAILPRHIGHEERGVNLVQEVCKRLRVPNECKELAVMVTKFHGKLFQALRMCPDTLVHFLTQLDAIRQPVRFKEFLQACEADARGQAGMETCPLPVADLMLKALAAVQEVDAGGIAQQCENAEHIKRAIHVARLEKVRQLFA